MSKKDPQDDDLAKKVAEAQKKADQESEAQSDEISRTEELETELQKMTELAKRTMADMQNLKRHTEEQRASIFSMASADIIKKLLPILDNFRRALEHAPTEDEWSKGIKICINNLENTLTESGLQKIEALGKPFDPNLHEALMSGPGENNIITEELESGYMVGDRVIRHSKVKVGDGS